MNEAYSTALMLLAVGMITVFTILALIVLLGNLLTSLVNRYFPEAKVSSAMGTAADAGIDPRKMAAIVSAIDVLTKGKARVTSISKSE